MPQVKVKNDEPFDVILRRFRRSCEKAGIFTEMRRREFYEKPTSVRKRKSAAAKNVNQSERQEVAFVLLACTNRVRIKETLSAVD